MAKSYLSDGTRYIDEKYLDRAKAVVAEISLVNNGANYEVVGVTDLGADTIRIWYKHVYQTGERTSCILASKNEDHATELCRVCNCVLLPSRVTTLKFLGKDKTEWVCEKCLPISINRQLGFINAPKIIESAKPLIKFRGAATIEDIIGKNHVPVTHVENSEKNGFEIVKFEQNTCSICKSLIPEFRLNTLIVMDVAPNLRTCFKCESAIENQRKENGVFKEDESEQETGSKVNNDSRFVEIYKI
jgi:hypothetical protein